MITEWDCLELVLRKYETMSGLDLLSYDDVDIITLATHAWNDAEAEAAEDK